MKPPSASARSWGLSGTERSPVWLGAALMAAFLVAIGILASSSNRLVQGLDEASHVLTSVNPWASPGWGIFFGYYLHPLWLLGQEHLFGFRLAGFAALILATLVFFAFFQRILARVAQGISLQPWMAGIVASLLIMAFSRYVVGMRTPNYDWVALVGGMIFAAGWFAVETRPKAAPPFFAEALIAFGLLTVFMGKWTAIPGYLGLLAVLGSWKENSATGRIRLGAALAAWLFFCFLVFLLYVTPRGIEAVWQAGWVQIAIHSSDRAWTRLPWDLLKFSWTLLRASPYVAAVYGAVWVCLFYARRRTPPAPQVVAGLTFFLGLPLVGIRGHFVGGGEYFAKGVMVTVVWFLGVWLMARTKPMDLVRENEGLGGRAMLLLLALPWLNGVGTATSMVDYLGYGLIFLVAAAWILLLPAHRCGLPSWCVAAAILTIGISHAARVATSTFHVHRLGSAWGEVELIGSGPEQDRFFQYPAAARALAPIRAEMEKHGYRTGDPVLGLTDLPGLVYFLGGVSPGVSWYQSYRMAENYAGVKKNLENIPPEVLEKCWVIFREKNKKSEALELVWPVSKGVPLPVRLPGRFLWPWEPREKQLEPVILYRPASLEKS